MNFRDRKVVMTGASGGIGSNVAAILLERGANLVTIARSGTGPGGAKNLRADLFLPEGIREAGEIVANEKPDILINLAGAQHAGPFLAEADLAKTYTLNLVAPAQLCKAALPGMLLRRAGQIVNVGSIFGSIGFAHFASYSSAKAGLRVLSEALRRELVDTGVSVTYIAPRAVKTKAITPLVERYARLTNMKMDDPKWVAAQMVKAISARDKDVYIGGPEAIFVGLNAIFPRLVDRALAGNDRKARNLFTDRSLVDGGST